MKTKLNIFVVTLMSFISFQCSTENVENDYNLIYSDEISPLGKISIEKIGSIGSNEDENYIFATITGLRVDSQGNLYVLDRDFNNLRVYNPAGTYIRGINFSKGLGPGEFNDPVSIGLSKNGNFIYISDMDNRRLTILDNNFKYVHSFSVNIFYFDIINSLDNNIIALCYRYTPRTNPDNNFLVHKFNTDGNEISKFGAFQKDFKSLSERNIQGAVHAFNTGVDSLVFLSFGYPYEIRIYDGNRDKFLKRFARKTSFHGKEIIAGEFTFVSGHTSGIAVTSNSLVMNFVYDRENKETYLHAFDFEGKNRGTIQMSDYNIKDSPYFDCATNNDDILYIDVRDPYPQILKFRIIYETN